MTQQTGTVLISSAGRRVALLESFRAAQSALDLADARVLAADMSATSSASRRADAAFRVPACDHPGFVPAMLDICTAHAVSLIVPTIDTELAVLANAAPDFAAVGATVAVSSPAAVAIAADKVATHAWLSASGAPTIRQATPHDVAAHPGDWPYPLVVKPRFGSAAVGVATVHDDDELRVASRGDVVVQSVATGREHTVDVLVDRQGRVVCAVPRRRLEVRAGEVSKAVTVRSARLVDLATTLAESLPSAYGALAIQVFHDERTDELAVIEINARFGGGYPLSHRAGADFPRWLLEEVTGRPSTATSNGWRDGLLMLRYDDAVFVEDAEL